MKDAVAHGKHLLKNNNKDDTSVLVELVRYIVEFELHIHSYQDH